MDSKEIKTTLKSARDALQKKDYKEALKHCKAILKTDEANLHATVFVGVALEGLEQTDKALAFYKKAIGINSDHLFGWQGLCRFYEKADNRGTYADDLEEVYRKLIGLHTSDPKEYLEHRLKLAQHLSSRDKVEESAELYHSLLHDITDQSQSSEILTEFIHVSHKLKSSTEEQNEQLLRAYDELSQRSTDVEVWTGYLKHLSKMGVDSRRLLDVAMKCSTMDAGLAYPWEIQAHIYLDRGVQDVSTCLKNTADVLEKLQSSNIDSPFVALIQGVHNLHVGNLAQAEKHLVKGVEGKRSCISGRYYLGLTRLRMHHAQHASSSLKKGLELLEKGTVMYGDRIQAMMAFNQLYIEACICRGDEDHLNTASGILDKLMESRSDESLKILLVKLHLASNNPQQGLQVLEDLARNDRSSSALTLMGWAHHLSGNHDSAKPCLSEALSISDTNSMAHYYMARVLYDQRTVQPESLTQCLTHLLKAAKQDQYYAPVFLYLGYYYGQILHDQTKASRCLQKAYDLDPSSEEAGSALIDTYMATNDQTKALHILKNVTSNASAGCAKWAWLRLGLYQLKHEDPTSAIKSLQSALRADSKDVHCWECLGEAYMNRGSYTAALKAFTRATELDESAMFCFYQMACIKQLLGVHDEAVTEYQHILENQDYVPAYKGLGETYIQMARAALKEYFNGRAVDYCQLALTVLTKAATLRSDLSCVWKLLGDACTILAPLPTDKVSLSVPSKLMKQTDSVEELVNVSKQDLLAVGARCYGMAIKLQPDYAALWHDLGLNYYHQSKMADKHKVKQLISKAVQSVEKAVTLDPGNHEHWNALGVVATSDIISHPGLAQHCFIKSIQVESNNVTAWTNLGVLYLTNDNIKLAHEAFKVAQSLEPSYVACWIGQSLIAEAVGSEDAMDLFRHTTELGNHLEGAVGYGHWVCKVLQQDEQTSSTLLDYAIRQMAAIPAASDALSKYLDRVADDPVAWNLYGLLLERQGLYTIACEALEKAVSLLEKSKKGELDSVRTNYARVLCGAGHAVSSVKQYRLCHVNTMSKLCGMALALYKDKQYEESLERYQKALDLALTPADQSHIHAAIGMVAYKIGDLAKAKGALFAGSQLAEPSVVGLEALLGIGLIQKDVTLCGAVLQEMEMLGDLGPDGVKDILAAEVHGLEGDIHMARGYLQKVIHNHPDRASIWLELAQYLTQQNTKPTATSRCLQVADILENRKCSQSDKSLFARDSLLLKGLSGLGAGHHDVKDPNNNAMNLAKKAVHRNPQSLANWFLLMSAAQSEQRLASRDGLHSIVLALTTRLMARVENDLSQSTGDTTRLHALHVWCVKQYIISLIEGGRVEQAQQFLQQAAWLYEDDVHLRALSAAFNENFSGLKNLANQDGSGFTPQLLISLYIFHGLQQEAKKAYQMWMRNANSADKRLTCLVQFAYFAFKNIQSLAPGADGRTDWMMVFQDACDNAVKLNGRCSVLWLMRGLLALEDSKRAKFAKRCLHRVLENRAPGALPHAAELARETLIKFYTETDDTEAIKLLQNH